MHCAAPLVYANRRYIGETARQDECRSAPPMCREDGIMTPIHIFDVIRYYDELRKCADSSLRAESKKAF